MLRAEALLSFFVKQLSPHLFEIIPNDLNHPSIFPRPVRVLSIKDCGHLDALRLPDTIQVIRSGRSIQLQPRPPLQES
jgi:hypothetical protein